MIRVVNVVPRGNSNETAQDSEPNIAVNPLNPREIVVTAFTPDPFGSTNAPYYFSTDGGSTFALNMVVPSVAGSTTGTGDITLRFGGPGGQGWDLRAGDSVYAADLTGHGDTELVVVSADGQWIGTLEDAGGEIVVRWIGHDWVNHPGGSGASGWDLRQGDRLLVADVDGDGRDEIVISSPDNHWVGLLREDGGGLRATWLGSDWVNPPGAAGGWDLRQGDRFLVADIDNDNRQELVVVSPNGEWIGVLRENAGALTAAWIGNDWVNHPGGTGASGWNLRQGDQYLVADIDGDGREEIIVRSLDNQWIGVLHEDGGALAAGWIGFDWVNPPGASGGWNLRQGDQFVVADIDGDGREEIIVLSPDTQWIGILRENAGALTAGWIGFDWVNHPGGTGATGWNLRQGDRFTVADIDGDGRDEIVVLSLDNQWIGVLREFNGGLSADWIGYDWVAPATGPGAMLAGGILTATARLRLQALRTRGFAAATVMQDIGARDNIDQPYTEAIRPTTGGAAGRDVFYIGINDFGAGGGRTATLETTFDAGAPGPRFSSARLERRNTSGQNGPPIRPAVHPDGTVYAVFSGWRSRSAAGVITADIVVVRDDDWGLSRDPYGALVDPGDNVAGMRAATGATFTFNFMMGQERISNPLSIAVDPSDSDRVWIAWGDQPGGVPTLHVRRSTDRGATWSADLRTIGSATNPALAVTSEGVAGFMYQEFTGTAPNTRWETHLQRTPDDGVTWVDATLATVPSNVPASTFLPYLGDYIGLQALGDTFYGAFSANNTPQAGNFPSGVEYQRNADWPNTNLRNAANTANVAASIDPFFVKVTPAPDERDVRVSCTLQAGGRIEALGGLENGNPWQLTVRQVIDRIELDQQRFFVEEPVGDRVDLVVAQTPRGRRYVKTTADGDEPNNLLALPGCP